MMKSLFELNGGTYSTVSDYRIPNLTVPEEPVHHIGIWGQRRLTYLKTHKHILYVNLLTSGKLAEHLSEIDAAASERHTLLRCHPLHNGFMTEQLKAENQMEWVGRMNNIRVCADEIFQNELTTKGGESS